MDKGARLSAVDYLDRFFEEIRLEARANPDFAARLTRALGGEVVFARGDVVDIANPMEIAANQGEAGLRETFAGIDAANLRKAMRTANLATPVDMRGQDADALMDMLVRRTLAKLAERRRA